MRQRRGKEGSEVEVRQGETEASERGRQSEAEGETKFTFRVGTACKVQTGVRERIERLE